MLNNTAQLVLWNAFRKGDKEAFRQLYGLYAKDLLTYGRRATHDDLLIEDCVHDLFIELWQSRANLSDTDSVKFYLFKSLRNKINHARVREDRFESSDFSGLLHPTDDFQIEHQLIEQEGEQQVFSQLRKSFELLTPRQQEAINLRFYQHFSNEEVAQIMGVNYQSACRFIYAALKTLREAVRILSVFWCCYIPTFLI
jgi:RNA polymerase sigma factor (sigma-70 family)